MKIIDCHNDPNGYINNIGYPIVGYFYNIGLTVQKASCMMPLIARFKGTAGKAECYRSCDKHFKERKTKQQKKHQHRSYKGDDEC